MTLQKILCNHHDMNFLKLFLKRPLLPPLPQMRSKSNKPQCVCRLLPRCHHLKSLKNDEFDVVVIGGGCVGAGCALDAATRGLKTALIECADFASGTSSKSTKLLHGGVRYLQEAITKCDFKQFKILKEALRERGQVLKMAPHLTRELPLLVPLRK